MTFLNKTGLERLWSHIISKLNGKVDKIDGKILSSNDFTDEEKNKLANLQDFIVTDDSNGNVSIELPTVASLVTSDNEQ